jgi:hypothetical protein
MRGRLATTACLQTGRASTCTVLLRCRLARFPAGAQPQDEAMARRQGEPALVLTPPEAPQDAGDDGVLTASEVSQLKLNAHWVILSACNTAAGDKPGA